MDKLTVKSDYMYILFKVNYLHQFNLVKMEEMLKKCIVNCFGEMGPITSGLKVMKFQPTDQTAIIRCYSDCYSAIWGALTLMWKIGENSCILNVIKISPFLTSLASTSRFSIPKPN